MYSILCIKSRKITRIVAMFFWKRIEDVKVRATVLLTPTVTNQCVMRHVSASRTAVWLVTAEP